MRIKKLLRLTEGSISLEAMLTFPPFAALLVFFFCLYRLAAIELAIQSAATESTRLAAHHWAITELATEAIPAGWQDSLNAQLTALPPALQSWGTSTGLNWAEEALKPSFKALVIEHAEGPFRTERLTVEEVELPTAENGDRLSLTVGYDVRLPVPFMERHWNIRVNASERVWRLKGR